MRRENHTCRAKFCILCMSDYANWSEIARKQQVIEVRPLQDGPCSTLEKADSMNLTLLPNELALLHSLADGNADAIRNLYEHGRRLFEFGLVVPARRGTLKLTSKGVGTMLRASCVDALRRKVKGDYVAFTTSEQQWLESNRFVSADGIVLARGKLWLELFNEQTDQASE